MFSRWAEETAATQAAEAKAVDEAFARLLKDRKIAQAAEDEAVEKAFEKLLEKQKAIQEEASTVMVDRNPIVPVVEHTLNTTSVSLNNGNAQLSEERRRVELLTSWCKFRWICSSISSAKLFRHDSLSI